LHRAISVERGRHPEADPLLAPETLSAARNLRDRFLGALIGLAVGDAVAAATQYRRAGTFTAVGDMIGGGPFDLPRGGWSDDTAMALCLADSLLECEGFDARDQVDRYARWQKEGYLSAAGTCVGITANTARALAVSQWRRHVFPGSHDPAQLDPETLSRVAPAVLFFFSSLDDAIQEAANAARTTCQAPVVLDACRHLARALHAALSGQSKAAILADGPEVPESPPRVNTTATKALMSALWAFSSTHNFRDAVLHAANVGGNSDVVAAACGQLAGAHYGVGAIPPAWRKGLIQHDLIESYADRLLAHALVELGE
jgi:ADP-ribosyl-[dinitrogen reductase] hydrolase